jgi:vanillate O-demethylase ferredoxin subunit
MKNNLHWHPATVRMHRDLSASVREFEIRPEGGIKPWTVGSHLSVQVQVDGRAETRFYSLVGLPRVSPAHDVYRIAVRRAEPSRGGSRFMWGLEAGAELLIGEPNNHFELALGAPQYLLVAGGIGITPILGMAQMLAERGANVRMRYAARHSAELAYLETLRSCLGDRLQTFTDDTGTRLNLETEIAALVPGGQLWICGPLPMLDAAREAWARSGRHSADLRFETFGNSGRAQAQAFWVELPRHGLRLHVPAQRSLLDVLEAAGIDTLADCRRGECGLCAIDIVRTEGTIDHRDVFFSAREKQANRRLCACVSRVSGGGVVLDSSYRPD